MAHDGRRGLATYPTADGVIPGYRDAAQWIEHGLAVARVVAERLGGEGIYTGGGDPVTSGTQYPAVGLIVYDDGGEAWYFRTSAARDIEFPETTGETALYAVIETADGVTPAMATGGRLGVRFVAQASGDPAPAHSLLLGTGTVAEGAFTDYTEADGVRLPPIGSGSGDLPEIGEGTAGWAVVVDETETGFELAEVVGEPGPQGPEGPQGPQGEQGPPGEGLPEPGEGDAGKFVVVDETETGYTLTAVSPGGGGDIADISDATEPAAGTPYLADGVGGIEAGGQPLLLATADPSLGIADTDDSDRVTALARTGGVTTLTAEVPVTGGTPIDGYALDFEASADYQYGQYVEVPDAAILQLDDAMSILCWVKVEHWPSVSPYVTGIVNKMTGYQDYKGYALCFGDGTSGNKQKLRFVIGPGAGWKMLTGSTSVSAGAWHHVCVTYDGTDTAKIYLDGSLDGTSDTFADPVPHTTNPPPLIIGNDAGTNQNRFFDGLIDEVRIYSRALSEEEIVADYASGAGTKGQPGTGLVGLWHLDEGTGTTAYDSSGNDLTGTLKSLFFPEEDPPEPGGSPPAWVTGKIPAGYESETGTATALTVDEEPTEGVRGRVTVGQDDDAPLLGSRTVIAGHTIEFTTTPTIGGVDVATVEDIGGGGAMSAYAIAQLTSSETLGENVATDIDWSGHSTNTSHVDIVSGTMLRPAEGYAGWYRVTLAVWYQYTGESSWRYTYIRHRDVSASQTITVAADARPEAHANGTQVLLTALVYLDSEDYITASVTMQEGGDIGSSATYGLTRIELARVG